jgi:cellulose 1,4-beta-cellobiosidase
MVMAASGSASGTASVTVTPLVVTPSKPVITSLTANPSAVNLGATSVITAVATDPDGDIQSYNWSASYGTVPATGGATVVYQAPSALPPGGKADVTVTVRDALSLSATSSVAITINNPALEAVAGVVVGNPTVNSLTLNWNGVTGATSYSVYRSTSDTGTYSLVISGIAATNYTNVGLSSNTYYYYKVSAATASGEGPQSIVASGLTMPGQVPIPLVANPTTNSLSISWTGVGGGGGVSYNVYRSTSPTGSYSLAALGITTTSFTNTGLSCGTTAAGVTYYYKVSAINASGEGLQSDYSSGTTSPCLPGQVTDLTVISPTVSSLTLGWSGVSGATSYTVYRSTDNVTYSQVVSGIATTSYTNVGLSSNTSYYYKVSSVSASGEGPQSGYVSGLTIPGQVAIPAVGSRC